MSVLLPALLLGAATTVAIGLPAPRRRAVLGLAPRAPRRLPPALLPVAVGIGTLLPLGPVGAAVAAGLAAGARTAWDRRAQARDRESERAAAAEAMVVLAGELRAGRAPAVALRRAAEVAVGPAGRALAAAETAATYGGSVADALHREAEHSAVPEMLRGFAACWAVCQGTGSSLAAAVDRLEEGLRAERERRETVATELAGPRATAVMLAAMPLFGMLLGAGMGAKPLQLLLHTPLGNVCLVLGLALDLAGLWWTSRIVRTAAGEAPR